MKTILQKRLLSSIVLFVLSFCTVAAVQAQQVRSDYEIQKEFKKEVKTINKSLEEVDSVAEAEKLTERIETLEQEYSDHESLINKAIYPETFDEKISDLEIRVSSTHQRLATIEKQDSKLQELNSELAVYSEKLQMLNRKTDSLQTAMQESIQSEKQLSDQLRDYRQNLQRRDELILSFIDSVVVTYRNLGIESMGDVEDASSRNRLGEGDNPLEMIQTIPSESIQLLEANSKLAPEDYLRMKTVHKEFTQMWNKVGDKLTQVYSENPDEVQSKIQQNVDEWRTSLNNKLWTSIQQSFEQNGIGLSEFDNSSSFFKSVNTYVEQGLTKSQEDKGQETYKKYTNFSDFWNNRVKGQWTEYMTQTDVLSSAQIATIDQKTNKWASIARPESNLLAYLLGVSVLAIAVLGFILFREKSNGNSDSSSS